MKKYKNYRKFLKEIYRCQNEAFDTEVIWHNLSKIAKRLQMDHKEATYLKTFCLDKEWIKLAESDTMRLTEKGRDFFENKWKQLFHKLTIIIYILGSCAAILQLLFSYPKQIKFIRDWILNLFA